MLIGLKQASTYAIFQLPLGTTSGTWSARNVVVATGHHDQPRIPRSARALPHGVTQLHTSRYRNPAQLPHGGVLVVGAGPSGQQIAEELARAGRRVVIAAGRHRTLPRRYRGLDAYWWMEHLGAFDRTVDDLADPAVVRRAPAAVSAAGTDDLEQVGGDRRARGAARRRTVCPPPPGTG